MFPFVSRSRVHSASQPRPGEPSQWRSEELVPIERMKMRSELYPRRFRAVSTRDPALVGATGSHWEDSTVHTETDGTEHLKRHAELH